MNVDDRESRFVDLCLRHDKGRFRRVVLQQDRIHGPGLYVDAEFRNLSHYQRGSRHDDANDKTNGKHSNSHRIRLQHGFTATARIETQWRAPGPWMPSPWP